VTGQFVVIKYEKFLKLTGVWQLFVGRFGFREYRANLRIELYPVKNGRTGNTEHSVGNSTNKFPQKCVNGPENGIKYRWETGLHFTSKIINRKYYSEKKAKKFKWSFI